MKLHHEFSIQFEFKSGVSPIDFAYALKAARKQRNTLVYDQYFGGERPVQGVLFD
jgi:hypothetical protein